MLSADFDGDRRADWAGLGMKTTGEWAILVAYNREDGWRAGNVDMGPKEQTPTSLALLPSGRHDRHSSCAGALAPHERESFESPLPGVIAAGPIGRKAYQLGPHAWGFVCMGSGQP